MRRARARLRQRRTCLSLLLLTVLSGTRGRAEAYQIDSPIHHGCHERFTARALATLSAPVGLPAEINEADRVLAHALQFDPAPYAPHGADRLTISLLVGVRYNDVRDKSVIDLGGIVPVHNVEARQREHCLRRAELDGAAGGAQALGECVDFIGKLVKRATSGLDTLDPWITEQVPVYLRFRGSAPVNLSRLYFNLGRAVHVLQDSFSHTVRAADGHQVLDVCNWIDDLRGKWDESRDGCLHQSQLDDCSCQGPAFERLMEQTVTASADLMRAVLETADAAAREREVKAVLERWMSLRPGCDASSNYCDNAVLREVQQDELVCGAQDGCAVGAGRRTAARTWWSALVPSLVLLWWLGRGRRRGGRWARLWPLVVLLCTWSGAAVAGPRRCPAPQPEPGLYLSLRNGISIDRPALSLEGGVLYRWRRLGVGLYAEYNPFLSFERGLEATSGAVNIAPSGTVHVQITPRLSMRFEARVGLSVLLFRTPGYDVGNVGLFLGLRALGLDYRIVRRLYLFIDPIDIGMPIFKVERLPFYYRQWRVSGGLAWRL